MKNVTVLLFMIFMVASLYSQSYEIDFVGTGDTTVVDSVKVENLNQNISLTLNGNDVLTLNTTTDINNIVSDINSLQVYPNPMTTKAEIQFCLTKNSNVLVVVYDVSGRSVIQSNEFLHPGIHKYFISGLNQGMYIIRINDQNSFYSAKLISQNNLNCEAEIEHGFSKNFQLNQTQIKQLKSTAWTRDMPYNDGDRLMFTGMSGNYSTVVTDVPSGNNTITFDFMDCTDVDDNHYPVVKIDTQTWMAENLATTKYNDGTPIPLVTRYSDWWFLTSPAYCWYHNNDTTYKSIYGALYNWFAVDTASNGRKNVCPTGWHVPTYAEWTTLIDYLGGVYIVGGKLKETGTIHWNSPNTGATNEIGFTALPGGCRHNFGNYEFAGVNGYFWSATEYDTSYGWYQLLNYNSREVARYHYNKQLGFSVRCLRD